MRCAVPSLFAVPFAAVVGCLMASAGPLYAQSGANITLQLPSFHSFGVNTTVLVPDSGPSPLARERQAFYSRTMYGGGLFPQRALGVQRGSTGVQVNAQVHDARQADEQLLLGARARRTNWTRGSTGAAGDRTPEAVRPALRSVADIERERAEQAVAAAREAAALLRRARLARDEGKPGVAAVYYGMAARRADETQRQQIETEAARLRQSAASGNNLDAQSAR